MALKSTGAIALEDSQGLDRSISAEFGGNDEDNVKISDYNRSHLPNKEDGTDWPDYSSIPLDHDDLKFSLYRGKKALYTAKITETGTNFDGYLFTAHPLLSASLHAFVNAGLTHVDITVEDARLKVVSYDITRRYQPAGSLDDWVYQGRNVDEDYFFTAANIGNAYRYAQVATSGHQNTTTEYILLSNRENVEKITLEWVYDNAYVSKYLLYAYGPVDGFAFFRNNGHDAHFHNATTRTKFGKDPSPASFTLNPDASHVGASFDKTITYERSFDRVGSPLASGTKMSTSTGVATQMRSSHYGWPSPCSNNIVAGNIKLHSGGSIKLKIKILSGGHTTTHVITRSRTNALNPTILATLATR